MPQAEKKITVKLPKKQYEALKKDAATQHLSRADIIRAFIQKGMSVDAYTEEIDFVFLIRILVLLRKSSFSHFSN
ncbi:hypothetical protein A3844_04080 [Paenibacillus helianthi]|uniref:Ribbon-helix-helix protein CopG domain-containing protein n=1 Tax=Paenibacillus helianthi TaxID=1349432 RepID=A0ABX3ET22_9BACL|nr:MULTISPECIES: ribbon-helix-helix domain-containing protein [Paenibacillus]OKP70357.1 hypothetical protein A3842_24650 [Paenibacillus sp. P3E]OKP91032.1 hypothetical protein A3844_04080 [Paenibacillus helianthi]